MIDELICMLFVYKLLFNFFSNKNEKNFQFFSFLFENQVKMSVAIHLAEPVVYYPIKNYGELINSGRRTKKQWEVD